MDCRQAGELIPLFVGDDLSAADMVTVREHLRGCEACAAEAADARADREWTLAGDAPLREGISDSDISGLHARVIGQIETAPPRSFLEGLVDALLGRKGLVSGRPGLLVGLATTAAVVAFVVLSGGDTNEVATIAPQKAGTASQAEIIPPAPARTGPVVDESWQVHWTRDPLDIEEARGDEPAPVDDPIAAPQMAMAGQARREIPASDPSIRIIWLSGSGARAGQ